MDAGFPQALSKIVVAPDLARIGRSVDTGTPNAFAVSIPKRDMPARACAEPSPRSRLMMSSTLAAMFC